MDTLDPGFAGGHGVVRFRTCACRRATCWARSAGLPLRAGAAGAGAADALHALARARRGVRTTSRVAYARQRQAFGKRSASTRASASCWPTTRWTCTPPADDLAHRLGAGPGRARGRTETSIAKVICSRGGLARRRPLRADAAAARGVTARDGRGAHLPRDPRLPHLRRPERGAPLEPGAAPREARSEPVAAPGGKSPAGSDPARAGRQVGNSRCEPPYHDNVRDGDEVPHRRAGPAGPAALGAVPFWLVVVALGDHLDPRRAREVTLVGSLASAITDSPGSFKISTALNSG